MTAVGNSGSANFGFLAAYDDGLVGVAATAERYFSDDPVTCLMKLRQFGELLAQQVAARAGVFGAVDEPQSDLLGRLRRDTAYSRDVIDLFHDLRRTGNEAVHQHRGTHATALTSLKVARQLAVWFHRTFGDRTFNGIDLNAAINPAVQALDTTYSANIELFDAYGLIADIQTNPGSYGYTNTTQPCLVGTVICATPDTYTQWDGAHKTTRVASIVANELIAQVQEVPEPGTLVLVGTGVAVFAVGRRRSAT